MTSERKTAETIADDLRNAVHGALYRVAVRFGADEVAAIETADAECAALDTAFGAQRHYWRAPAKESRNREILAALQAGKPPEAVAAEHGVHPRTVEKIRAAAARKRDEPDIGLGREDWVL